MTIAHSGGAIIEFFTYSNMEHFVILAHICFLHHTIDHEPSVCRPSGIAATLSPDTIWEDYNVGRGSECHTVFRCDNQVDTALPYRTRCTQQLSGGTTKRAVVVPALTFRFSQASN